MSDDLGRNELEEIRGFIANNRDMLKPMFGMMFWQLQALETRMSATQFAEQGMSLAMADPDDEILAGFMGSFLKLWHNSGDFNAASRFICSALEISADELLQTRQMYLEALDSNVGSVT